MKIKGWKTNDLLAGTDGDDIIKGGRGDDTIAGKGGFDILYGGKGHDTFVIAASDFDAIADFQPGKDRIIIDAGLYGGGGGGGEHVADHIDYSAPILSYEGEAVAILSGVPLLSDGDLFIY